MSQLKQFLEENNESTIYESPGADSSELFEEPSTESLLNSIIPAEKEETEDKYTFEIQDFSEIFETPMQKLKRLQIEAFELYQELESQSGDANTDVQNKLLLESLSKAQKDLKKLDERVQLKSTKNSSSIASASFAKLKKARSMLKETDVQNSVSAPPELFYKKELTHMFELETRIKNLEKLLGSETQKAIDMPEFQNFGGNLLRAYELMSLFTDPVHLDYAIQRLQLINSELEGLSLLQENLVSEGQHAFFDDEIEVNNQVDQLLELFERIEALVQQAPILTSRLKTMGSFHNEALDMNLVLPKLDSLVKASKEDSKLCLERSQKVSDSLQNNLNMIDQSYKGIEAKLTELSQRLSQLEGH